MLVVACALALVASACGDDDDDGESSSPTESDGSGTTVQPDGDAPTGAPLKVAMIVNDLVPTSDLITEMAQAWAEDANARGGVGGHPVEVVEYRTKGDSPTALSQAEEIIADDSIVAVFHQSTQTEGAVGEVFSAAKVPVLGSGYNPTIWSALPYWYTTSTTLQGIIAGHAQVDIDEGLDTVAFLVCAEDPSCAAAAPLYEPAIIALGGTYAGTVAVAADSASYTAECLEFVNQEVDDIRLGVIPAVASRVVEECNLQGYSGYYGATAGTVTPEIYEIDGIRLVGLLQGFPWWVDDEPVKHYVEVMESNEVPDDAWAQPQGTANWSALELFKKAMDDYADSLSETVTRDDVIAALGAVSDETLDGLLPQPLSFTADAVAPQIPCYWAYTFEDGEFSGDLEPECYDG